MRRFDNETQRAHWVCKRDREWEQEGPTVSVDACKIIQYNSLVCMCLYVFFKLHRSFPSNILNCNFVFSFFPIIIFSSSSLVKLLGISKELVSLQFGHFFRSVERIFWNCLCLDRKSSLKTEIVSEHIFFVLFSFQIVNIFTKDFGFISFFLLRTDFLRYLIVFSF